MLYDKRWDAKQEVVPTFTRRWWHRADGLDIRPVLWSLRNRPDEWSMPRDGYTIMHEPSKHEFWVSNGFWFYGLYSANCSCQKVRGGQFSLLQKARFGIAYMRWHREHQRPIQKQRIAATNAQFAEHFVASLTSTMGTKS